MRSMKGLPFVFDSRGVVVVFILMNSFIAVVQAEEIRVAVPIRIHSLEEFKSANKRAKPGDVLVLESRVWRDTSIVFTGFGTREHPITLRAAEPGKVIFTGRSSLRLGGEHLIVKGLQFQNPDLSISDLIQFRKDSKSLSRYCRVTDCSVKSDAPSNDHSRGETTRWVSIYGESNRVDHCVFEGKRGRGTTLVVWLGGGNRGGHQIDRNVFGPRPRLGQNGGETIRIGDSKTSMLDGDCLIEKNLFERCNGEAECISNKSCRNTYRENTFVEVAGTLTLRHGNHCRVQHNVFLGNGIKETGGIRVIGEDHVVENNFLSGLTGDDARSAITLMMGVPNSPLNRYSQVKRSTIRGNVLVDCKHSLLIGLSDDSKATLPPIQTAFIDNQFISPKFPIVDARCDLGGIRWSGNQFVGHSLGIPDVDGMQPVTGSFQRIAAPSIPRDVGTSW